MMGLSYRREGKTQWFAEEQRRASPRVTDLYVFSALLIALQILGPLAGIAGATARLANGQEKLFAVKCAHNCQARLVSIDPRTSIHLVDSMVGLAADRRRELRERAGPAGTKTHQGLSGRVAHMACDLEITRRYNAGDGVRCAKRRYRICPVPLDGVSAFAGIGCAVR